MTETQKTPKEPKQEEKGGKNYIKDKKRIARLHEKIRNSRNDFLHKKSTDVIKSHNVICMESLGVKDLMEKEDRRKVGSIQDASWAKFMSMLEYKAKWYGKTVQRVPWYFPSTQLCSCCGNQIREEIQDTRIREWECPVCSSHHYRDINVSTNILKEVLFILSGEKRTAGTAGSGRKQVCCPTKRPG
jgi:putative transposase